MPAQPPGSWANASSTTGVIARIKNVETNMPPKKEYSVSFIAPYSLFVDPKIAMRKYFGTITSS